MTLITIPGPPALYVRWHCRRCGHDGGFAKTTVPIIDPNGMPEETMRALFEACRRKMVKVHMRAQGCIAVPDDIVLSRGVPADKTISGLV